MTDDGLVVDVQVQAACAGNGLTPTCTVASVVFSAEASTSLTATTFKLSVADTTTDAQKRQIFDDIVAAAEANTLVSGEVVLASTVTLGPCKYLYNYVRVCIYVYSLHQCCILSQHIRKHT